MWETPTLDVHAAIRERRTIHSYRPEQLEAGVLERSLDAAHQAPCHKLTFPWRFVVCGPRAREGLANLAVSLKSAGRTLPAEKLTGIQNKILDPAELVVVTQVRCDDEFRSREDYAACACAIENMSLSLIADGVGSKWSTGGLTRDRGTYDLLGIESEVEEIIGFIWVGLPAETPTVKRPALDSVVRHTD